MKYRLNLVRDIQREQRAAQSRRVKMVTLTSASFGLLVLSLFYTVLQVLAMQDAVSQEKMRLKRIRMEYQHYRTSMMIVNKSDIENLDKLQDSRIFWTKKLVTLARYLPPNFWITRFAFDNKALTVEGYGYISPQQQQLITLNEYLNTLRDDAAFNDVFRQVYLNSAVRNDDEQKRARISFSFTAAGGK